MNILDSYGKLDVSGINALEQKLGYSIPNDYKSFLLRNNGGRPDGNWLFPFYEKGNPQKTESVVNLFYHVGNSDVFDPDDLATGYFALVESDQIPAGFLPIAEDPFGNFILLVLTRENYGEILFGDAELEDPTTGYLIMSTISTSFSDFMNSLYQG